MKDYGLRVLVSVFLLAQASLAQSTFGSISGTVKDSSGALVPSATVEAINVGTGSVRHAVTGSAGVFNIPSP